MFLRPARVQVRLAPLRWRPVSGHGGVINHRRFLFLGERLLRGVDDRGIDHLTATGDVAMPCQCRLTVSKTLSLASALISRSLKFQIVVRSGIWLESRRPAKRWKLRRSSNCYSVCSSDRLNSCWISRIRTITSAGNCGLAPRSCPGRGAAS
jgi:hypothetical protein